MRILRIREVSEKTGLSKSSIYKQIRLGKFPRGIKLTERASGWDEEAVHDWVAERIAILTTCSTRE
jgi:prophage regulatory protein